MEPGSGSCVEATPSVLLTPLLCEGCPDGPRFDGRRIQNRFRHYADRTPGLETVKQLTGFRPVDVD